MPAPAPWDITIYKGDDYELPVRIRVKNTNEYVDVTGWSGRAQLRASAAATVAIADFTVTPDPDQANPDTKGYLYLRMARDVTTGLAVGEYVYDMETTRPDGAGTFVETLIAGKATVSQDVTRT